MRSRTIGPFRRPWLAASALFALVGTALLSTPAVPFATTDAAVKTGPDAGQAAAGDLAVQAVFRVADPTDGDSGRRLPPKRRTLTAT